MPQPSRSPPRTHSVEGNPGAARRVARACRACSGNQPLCAQLREQLVRVLGFWQVPFDAQQARQCVRTFHSAMAQLAREVLSRPVWFEQLDDKAAAADERISAGFRAIAQTNALTVSAL